MIARVYAGEPVAVVRGKDGKLFALENRCAHRQVPLTHGVVQGCQVKCGYHGWAYDASGACVDVPYLGKERLPNGVKAYPCKEVDGLIFIFPGDPALAEQHALPAALGSKARPEYKTRQLNRQVQAHYTFMHENLFDMNHQFLHRKQMGMIKAKCLGKRVGPDWCEVDYTFSRTEGSSTVGETAILGVVRKRGEGENADLMTIRTGYPLPGPQGVGGRRRAGAARLAWLHALGQRAAHQPHLRLPVGQAPGIPGLIDPGLAVHHHVHRADLQGRQGDRGDGAGPPTTARATTGTTRCSRRSATCATCWPAAAYPTEPARPAKADRGGIGWPGPMAQARRQRRSLHGLRLL
ncbi:MAG: Rieske 2Fe-2S domain-containing protein [Caulobacteraceae bacterium]